MSILCKAAKLGRTFLNCASLAVAAGFLSSQALAFELPENANDEAKAAYKVLDKYCARCHQTGKLGDGLSKAKSGFGHVLELDRLARDPKFVIPGDIMKSQLSFVIGPNSWPPMPDDCTAEKPNCFPTDEELKQVEDWIVSLNQKKPEPRTFVSISGVFKAALNDIFTVPAHRQSEIRYLSLRVPHNDIKVSDDELDAFRQATVKLMNALSWNPKAFKFDSVDENNVLIRFRLSDLRWTPNHWADLLDSYPYGVTASTDTNLKQLTNMTQSHTPIIRADWFIANASVPPLYHSLLQLPETYQGLEKLLGVDTFENIRDGQVVRAGFQNSGVSSNNRLIERHEIGTGFFWTSYDFAGNRSKQNFFEFPLGPKGVDPIFDDQAFDHDGGETIFSLPNGFHAYYLNTAAGGQLDVGPTDIVRDDDYTDGTGEVVNGISCISCHSKGMRFNKDDVRSIAMNDLTLSPEQRQIIDEIYPGEEEVRRVLQKDQDNFFKALRSAGIDPETTARGREPIRGMFIYYKDDRIDLDRAAVEIGMTPDEFRQKFMFADREFASMLRRLDQSPIARDEWETVFPDLISQLTDYRPIIPKFSSTSEDDVKSASISDYKSAHQSNKRLPKKRPVSTGHRDQSLAFFSDKSVYNVGDPVKLTIEPRHDCRLTIINIDSHGESCQIYPLQGLKDEIIPAGSRYVFPPRGSMKTQKTGTEHFLAFCNSDPSIIAKSRAGTQNVSCAVNYETMLIDLNDDEDHSNDNKPARKGVGSQNASLYKHRITIDVR